jgi:AbrB family looped-hinge helix DNA binding protein
MPIVKVRDRNQVTIPKAVAERLSLKPGDLLEMEVHQGKGVFIPRRSVPVAPAPRLSAKEQRVLEVARKKIAAIQKDLKRSKGLAREEAAVAAKVGLIDPEQQWWWLESWQEGEREAQRDIDAGRVTTYDSLEAFLKSLATR